MAITHLKGAYYDSVTQSIWTLNNAGVYTELTLGGGVTIYTGDGSVSANRVIDLSSHQLGFVNGLVGIGTDDPDYLLTVNDGANDLLTVDAVFRQSTLSANDGTANSSLALSADSGQSNVTFNLSGFGGSGNGIAISGDSIAETISYFAQAGGHTFVGVVNLPVQSAPASPNDGDIWREDNTDTGLKIRINGVTKTITVS